MNPLNRCLLGLALWSFGWCLSWFPFGDHPYFFLVMLISLVFFTSPNNKRIENSIVRFIFLMSTVLMMLGLVRTIEPYMDQMIVDLSRNILFMGASTTLLLVRVYLVATIPEETPGNSNTTEPHSDMPR